MFTDVSLALNPSMCFVRCQCQIHVLWKAIAPLGTQQASENGDFYLQNYHNYKISNSSFRSHADPQHPPLSKKERNYCHLAYQNHFCPSRWPLLTTHCRLGPRCTEYCNRTSSNCTTLAFWVTIVLCPEIGSSSHKLSISHLRSTRNVHKRCIDTTYTSLSVAPCKWHLLRTFW